MLLGIMTPDKGQFYAVNVRGPQISGDPMNGVSLALPSKKHVGAENGFSLFISPSRRKLCPPGRINTANMGGRILSFAPRA